MSESRLRGWGVARDRSDPALWVVRRVPAIVRFIAEEEGLPLAPAGGTARAAVREVWRRLHVACFLAQSDPDALADNVRRLRSFRVRLADLVGFSEVLAGGGKRGERKAKQRGPAVRKREAGPRVPVQLSFGFRSGHS